MPSEFFTMKNITTWARYNNKNVASIDGGIDFNTYEMIDTGLTVSEEMKKYKEELLFTGNGMTFSAKTGQPFRGGMMFFVNQDTGTWSMLQLFGDGMSCMIMNGRDFEPFAGKSMYKDKL